MRSHDQGKKTEAIGSRTFGDEGDFIKRQDKLFAWPQTFSHLHRGSAREGRFLLRELSVKETNRF